MSTSLNTVDTFALMASTATSLTFSITGCGSMVDLTSTGFDCLRIKNKGKR